MTEFERCLPWIVRALHKSGNRDTLQHVVERIQAGTAQFWPAPDGCLVTEMVDYPSGRALRIWLAGGEIGQILDMTGDVAKWARAQGCVVAEFSGRLGWEKPLRKAGWKPRAIRMELDLNDGQ